MFWRWSKFSREERDVLPDFRRIFVDTGTILGGTVKLRNAVEAAVLCRGQRSAAVFICRWRFNIRLMIVIAVSVPLGVFRCGRHRR